ncbi:MAG: TonB-dependent receptor [Blastocatellia bacterium]
MQSKQFTTKADGTRDQISCNGVLNVICASRQSAIARNLLKYWPNPNTTPTNVNTQANNFFASGTNINNSQLIDSRVDHVFSERLRSFLRVSRRFKAESRPFNHYGNAATPNNAGPVDDTNTSISMDNVYTFSPTLVMSVRYGLSRRTSKRTPFSAGFDFTQLGFPTSLKSVADALEFPRFDISGVSSLGQETFNDLVIAPTTHSFIVGLTKTYARHTWKFGMDYRFLMLNFTQLSQPAGQYTFNQSWTQRVFNSGSSTAGFGFATFLLGVPGSSNSTTAGGGTLSHDPSPASSSPYYGFYAEDSWRVSSKLTATLGLRYELDVPRTERFNRYGWFDFDATSPLAGKVPANPYFDSTKLKGAVNFVTADNRRQVPTDKNNFGPRIGFAYNITPTTVLRAAYGISYSPSSYQAAGHTGSSGMVGFRTASQMVVSLDGRVPVAFLDNPFPSGFNLPTGTALGASTRLGLSVGGGDGGVFPDTRSPYIQQWNANVQRELPGSILFEAAYLGSKGTRLLAGESGLNYNQLPVSFLTLQSGYTSLDQQLNTLVANPFFGIFTNPTSNLRFATVQRKQLWRPFPQYDAVSAFRVPFGFSIYHAGTVKADKRFSNGMSFLAAYTWSKLIDDVSTTVGFLGQASTRQNVYDRAAERAISSQDIAHRFVSNFTYDLPFGKNKKFGANWHPVVNGVLGGWQFNGIVTFQSGLPILITQGANNVGLFNPSQRPTWNGTDGNLSGSKTDKIAKWFDTGDFSLTPAFTFGNSPRVMPNLRQDGEKNFDLSFFKNYYIRETKSIQFRAEFFNAFNRVRFAGPNSQIDSGSFGLVSGQGNGPRQIQLALKLIF